MSKVIRHKDVKSFLRNSLTFLSENETMNNLMLGLSLSIEKRERDINGEELFYSLVDNEQVVGCAMRSDHDRPFILSDLSTDSIKKLIKKLRSDDVILQSVIGPSLSVKNFIGMYGRRTKLVLNQGVFELSKVNHPNFKDGMMKKASLEDLEICTYFLNGFLIDSFEQSDLEKAKEMMIRNIEFNDVYLWVNNENLVVSMCAKTRAGIRGVAISLVYTPPEYRNKGYASACVAACSEQYLNEGHKICYLHTDLANPTSNKIYQQIGYQKIGEMIHYDFLSE